MIPDPEPNVVEPISVVSRLISKVPLPLSDVSTPFVPPEMVLVAPKAVVDEPESPAKVMVELSSSVLEIDVPRVVDKVLAVTVSPVPANSEIVSPPTVSDPVDTEPVTVTLVEKSPAPTTSSETVGAVVPIPTLFEKEAVPEVKICWFDPNAIEVSVPALAS